MHKQPKPLVFLGPPGSGKGTQAARLSAALEIPAISTGDILRREVQAATELGLRLQSILQSGRLIADDQMNEIVSHRIGQKDCKGGFILDGYPRTVGQAKSLGATLRARGFNSPLIFDLTVSSEDLIERLRWRRQCPTCQRVYGLSESTARVPSVCQNDRSMLVARDDDQPAAIRERLEIYNRNSSELVRFYAGCDYHRIRAGCDVAGVTEQLFEALGLRALAPQPAPAVRLATVSC